MYRKEDDIIKIPNTLTVPQQAALTNHIFSIFLARPLPERQTKRCNQHTLPRPRQINTSKLTAIVKDIISRF